MLETEEIEKKRNHINVDENTPASPHCVYEKRDCVYDSIVVYHQRPIRITRVKKPRCGKYTIHAPYDTWVSGVDVFTGKYFEDLYYDDQKCVAIARCKRSQWRIREFHEEDNTATVSNLADRVLSHVTISNRNPDFANEIKRRLDKKEGCVVIVLLTGCYGISEITDFTEL